MAGKWLWTEDWNNNDESTARMVLFRAEIRGDIPCGRCRITADTRYKLYVNGHHVQSGPAKGDDKIRFVDEAEISEYLTEESNVIAVSVLKYPFDDPLHSNHSLFTSEMPGLYIDGFDPEGYGSKWRSHVVRNTRFEGEEGDFAPLHIHERTATDPEVTGWKYAGFNDSEWSAVKSYGCDEVPDVLKPENLAGRTIPYMRKAMGRFSSSDAAWDALIKYDSTLLIKPDTETVVTLDGGEEMTAFPLMRMHGSPGTEIELLYSECYVIPTEGGNIKANRLDSEHGILEGYTDTFLITEEGDWEYEPYWFRTFRFVRIRIRTGAKPLTINSITFEETGYPLDVRTNVATSDSSLSDILDISLRTLRRCMQETYTDCPFYEQLQYVMDTRSQALFTYALSADDRLARKAIDDFRRSQRDSGLLNACYPNKNTNIIPGFSMFYILMIHDYMMYFEDKELVRTCMPSVDKALRFFNNHIEESGMVGKIGGLNRIDPIWSFIDWAENWMSTTGMPRAGLAGGNTPENLLYVMGLQAAADLSEYIGDGKSAAKYIRKAEDVMAAIRRLCMNERGFLTDGPGSDDLSQHSQVLGVLTGLFGDEEAKSAMYACMTEDGFTKCTVAWNYYLFRALEKTGLYYLTDGCWDAWRDMIANGSTTCTEAENYCRSECHAWGALALYELPSVTLGVRPASPGYEKISVKPVIGYLSHAEGTVCTPHGDIYVAWTADENGEPVTKIECSDDIRARIV